VLLVEAGEAIDGFFCGDALAHEGEELLEGLEVDLHELRVDAVQPTRAGRGVRVLEADEELGGALI
jgi:hypothetical protein